MFHGQPGVQELVLPSVDVFPLFCEKGLLGLNSCVALRQPLVSEANRQKQLQFAREHKDWTLELWTEVMWSDESRFTLFQRDRTEKERPRRTIRIAVLLGRKIKVTRKNK